MAYKRLALHTVHNIGSRKALLLLVMVAFVLGSLLGLVMPAHRPVRSGPIAG
jgi:hypothetical protein